MRNSVCILRERHCLPCDGAIRTQPNKANEVASLAVLAGGVDQFTYWQRGNGYRQSAKHADRFILGDSVSRLPTASGPGCTDWVVYELGSAALDTYARTASQS